MDTDAYVPVGRVVRLHGLRGDIVVRPAGDVPFPLSEGLRLWFVPPPLEGPRAGTVAQVRTTAKGQIVHLAGFETAEAARALVGKTASARSADVPEGWDDEEPDLVGVVVVDEERGRLGTIAEVIITGANDVWVVRGGPLGEVLVPVIDDVVGDYDEDTDTVRVRLLPGLIEGE
jgi:16S rRNA processing protein RimM